METTWSRRGRRRVHRLKLFYGPSQARKYPNNDQNQSLCANENTEHKEYVLQTLFKQKNEKNMTSLPNLLPVDLDPKHNYENYFLKTVFIQTKFILFLHFIHIGSYDQCSDVLFLCWHI